MILDKPLAGLGPTPTGYGPSVDPYTGEENGYAGGGRIPSGGGSMSGIRGLPRPMGHHAHRIGMSAPKVGRAPSMGSLRRSGTLHMADGGVIQDPASLIGMNDPRQLVAQAVAQAASNPITAAQLAAAQRANPVAPKSPNLSGTIGQYLADLNKQITTPVNWGTGAAGGTGGTSIPWAKPSDFPVKGGTGAGAAGSSGAADILSGVGGVAAGIATALKNSPTLTNTVKDMLGVRGFDPTKFATSPDAIAATDALQTQLDAMNNIKPPQGPGDISGYDPSKPFVTDYSGLTPAQSADAALAESLGQPLTGAPVTTLPSYTGLKDFSSLTPAQSADAALEAALSPMSTPAASGLGYSALSSADALSAYNPVSTYVPDFTSATSIYNPDLTKLGDVNSLLDTGVPNINMGTPAATFSNPFGLSKLGNAGATAATGLLVNKFIDAGQGGQLGSAIGSLAGPVGAAFGSILGEMLMPTKDPMQISDPLTGATGVTEGTPYFDAVSKYLTSGSSAPQYMQGMTAGAGNNPGGMNMSGMLGSGVINQAIKQSYAANQPAQNYIDNQIPIVWLAKQYIATGGDPSKIPPEIQKLIQQQTTPMAAGGNVQGYAQGGIAGIPSYAAGGKFLRGPGDGMSDSIPAMIHGHKPQQAALADGEFVIPADVVSHLGNGSSEAGSRKLYDMMDRIRKARTGRKTQGTKINPDKFLPR